MRLLPTRCVCRLPCRLLGRLPPPLWGRVGEGGGAVMHRRCLTQRPPPPAPPQPKSGLPDFGQSKVPNPGKPGFGGEGSAASTRPHYASNTNKHALGCAI